MKRGQCLMQEDSCYLSSNQQLNSVLADSTTGHYLSGFMCISSRSITKNPNKFVAKRLVLFMIRERLMVLFRLPMSVNRRIQKLIFFTRNATQHRSWLSRLIAHGPVCVKFGCTVHNFFSQGINVLNVNYLGR